MAYQINKTDGTIISTVADGQVDTLSTDLTLIGKNYSGFGEALNENFIKLLENFSSTQAPTYPLKGQVWFDTSENKLKVYNGSDFIPVSSATISSTQPETLSIGDLWWNDVAAQLYFFDGTNPVLLAPAYSQTQGRSGLEVASILDTVNQTRVITYLYNNGILLGIFAKDSFTPKIEIIGFTGNIQPGFNAGNLAGIKFNVTCTNSEQLGGAAATTYVRTDTSNIINGQVRISTDSGLVVGSAGQMNLYVTAGDIFMSNAATDKNLILNVRKGINQENAIVIEAGTRKINFYQGFADSEATVGGNLTVSGNLTVEGTTTTINTATLTIEDKNIVIANVTSPTDITADGAGITIKGDTDKTILYSESNNWLDISEDINLSNPLKSFLIGTTPVIQPILPFTGLYKLGSAITEIPGVINFGPQIALDIGPGLVAPSSPLANVEMRLEDNRISTVKDNLDLELSPDGTGNVALIGNPRITGLADPLPGPGNEQDAATREYVDATIETRSIAFSMDLTDGKPNSYIITNILDILAPVSEYRTGTIARILCTLLSASSTSLDINALPPSVGTSAFITDHITGASANAVTNITFPVANIPASALSTSRIIKTFIISESGFPAVKFWSHTGADTLLPP
jgi:hypothetical protein